MTDEEKAEAAMLAAVTQFREARLARENTVYLYSHPEVGNKTPACWNDMACQIHQCREFGCAVMRKRDQ